MALAGLCMGILIPSGFGATQSKVEGGKWKIEEGANTGAPGNKVDVTENGKLIARLIHGPGQFKPYLHVFGEEGELLTNGGLDAEGKATGQFPHHRGIFLGWKIDSELGTDDLWHMTKGCKMEIEKNFNSVVANEKQSTATIKSTVLWHAGKKDKAGSDLLVTETRNLTFSRPGQNQTIIDATFVLNPARDVSLVGDLQHSGVHFRASNEVATRAKETSYLFEPERKVKGNDLKWVRLLFPIGERWYTAMEMNAPSNPVEEVSMRDYGRFGYFFKKKLKEGEPLTLRYRFLVEAVEAPADKPKQSAEQVEKSKAHCQELFEQFVDSLK